MPAPVDLLPFTGLAPSFKRADVGGDWQRVGQHIGRNFDDLEDVARAGAIYDFHEETTTIQTEAEAVAYTVTVTVPPRRRIEVEVDAFIQMKTGGTRGNVRLRDGATTGATLLNIRNPKSPSNGENFGVVFKKIIQTTKATTGVTRSGERTFAVTIERSLGGAGDWIRLIGDPTFPSYIVVYDRGPAR